MTKFEQVISQINAAKTIAVFSHMNYDNDALGSLYGLTEYLKTKGKKVETFLDSKITEVDAKLFDPKLLSDQPKNYDLVIMVDCANGTRLGKYLDFFKLQKNSIRLDHHSGISKDAKLEITMPYSSACEVILELIEKMGDKPTKKIATYLYAGLASDTVSFQAESVTTRTFENAYKLAKYGADISFVNQILFKTKSLALHKLKNLVFDRIKIYDNDIAISFISQKDLKKYGLSFNNLNFTDELTGIDQINIACLIKEKGPNTINCSFRCKKGFNVAKITNALGGGGHKEAAACILHGSLKSVKQKVLKTIREER